MGDDRPYRLDFPQEARLLVLMLPGTGLELPPSAVGSVTATRFRGDEGVGYSLHETTLEPGVELRFEYRSDYKLWIFKPFGGLMATSDATASTPQLV